MTRRCPSTSGQAVGQVRSATAKSNLRAPPPHGRKKKQVPAQGDRRQRGSLEARDNLDSTTNGLDIGADDLEDLPPIDELLEMFARLP